jgi:integrase
MAAIQERNGSFRVLFRHNGKQYAFTVGKVPQVTRKEAEATAGTVDLTLLRLNQRLLRIPPGVDLVTFVRHGGNVPVTATDQPVTRDAPTLASLRERYIKVHEGSLERHTLRGIRQHFRHLARILGEGFPIRDLRLDDLQGYVDRRQQAEGRRGKLNPATVRKEIVTLRTAWNWGVKTGIVAGRFPYDGLRYRKGDEKPPFQTRAEIERQLPGLPPEQGRELWESLYLTLPEIGRLLGHLQERAAHPWVYPLVATAAHTGARKGELLRMQVGDVDFEAGVVTVRERKRVHGRRTTRRVPLSPMLAAVLKDWLAVHPGGPLLFAQAEEVPFSKKRSRTTGHRSSAKKDPASGRTVKRPSRMAERRAGIRKRSRPGMLPLTEDEAHDHLKRTLAGSEWAVVRGLHTLRHSFISACASKGIDQRLIDEWVGHQSEEQRRRYRHLYPSVQAEAIRAVFG